MPKDCSNGKLRCIHFQLELAVLVRGNKYWWRCDNINKHVKGLVAVGGPFKDGFFLQEICKRPGKAHKIWNEGTLITEDSKDFSDFFGISQGVGPVA